MKLLVTGAGGFLGRYIVAVAVRRGHFVRAMIRPATRDIPPTWVNHPQVEIVRGDLRAQAGVVDLVDGVDAVIHAAATKSGDLHTQFSGTVIGTENLLNAMNEVGVCHLVATSSFTVYEYLHRRSWALLDERSPLARDPAGRDGYCQTKLLQERLIQDAAADPRWRAAILRPGAVYGRNELWPGRVATHLCGRWWLRIGSSFGRLPLTYVENCAEAVVLAAEYDGPARQLVLNIVDSDLPTASAYIKALKRESADPVKAIPVPWTAWRLMARLAWMFKVGFFGGNARLPGLLVPARIHAVAKPLRFPNASAREALGWEPPFSWREGLARACGRDDLTALTMCRTRAGIGVQNEVEQVV